MKTKLGLAMLASLFFFGVSIAGICPPGPPCVTKNDLVNGAVTGSKIRRNSIRTTKIRNGTIRNADIAAAAVIAATKIRGDAGVDFTFPTGFAGILQGDYTMKNLANVTITAPAAGYVVVVHTGHCVFFGESKQITVGVGTDTTAFTTSLDLGYLDGGLEKRFDIPYTVLDVVSVDAGSSTFHALAQAGSGSV